jgi:hypothetical protein
MGMLFSRNRFFIPEHSICTMENPDICPYSRNRINETMRKEEKKTQTLRAFAHAHADAPEVPCCPC